MAPLVHSRVTGDCRERHWAWALIIFYLESLVDRVLVYDGAMGTSIQQLHLTAEDFGGRDARGVQRPSGPDTARRDSRDPRIVSRRRVRRRGDVHLSVDAAPAGRVGAADKARDLNVAAARLAREACDKFATPDQSALRRRCDRANRDAAVEQRPRAVARHVRRAERNVLPAGEVPGRGRRGRPADRDGQDILEVKAAIAGFERLFAELGRRVPVQAQVTLDTSGRMLLGTDIASAMTTLEALPVDVIGLNCSTGPEHMREPVRYLAEHAIAAVSGDSERRPADQHGHGRRRLSAGAGADGGDARRVRQRVRRARRGRMLRDDPGAHRGDWWRRVRGARDTGPWRPTASRSATARARRRCGRSRSIRIRRPLIVGERVNAQGSRKVKRLLLADDYDGMLDVARDQMEAGAHVLDVCVALTERGDEAAQMARVVKVLSLSVETPLVIDSTEADVIEKALEQFPAGRSSTPSTWRTAASGSTRWCRWS